MDFLQLSFTQHITRYGEDFKKTFEGKRKTTMFIEA